jgi:hypothetical protein
VIQDLNLILGNEPRHISEPQNTMASSTKSFDYLPLDSNHADSFRLLNLLPGDFNSPILCTLTHDRHGVTTRPYESLSYTWGDPGLTSEIFVNGLSLPVTQNLEQALRSLRDDSSTGGQTRTLWVDAICIDQSQIPERNQQVAQMQEIYAGAERVVIWLGEASFDSDTAIPFIKQLCGRLEELGIHSEESQDVTQYMEKDFQDGLDGFLGPLYEDKWEAVALLLQRRWWERAWVFQELATARIAVCYCGKASIAWPLLSLTIQLLGTCKMRITLFPHQFRTSGALDRAWGMVQIRRWLASRGSIDLLSLLYRNRYRICLDPRDKIYSIIGMTNERTRLKLKPDYIKSVAEVFIMAVANDMEIHGDLEILNLIDHDTVQFTYPSWVADWGRCIGRAPRTWRFTKYVPESAPYKSAFFSPVTFSDDLQLLHADGFRIDVVEVDNIQQTVQPFQRNTTTDYDNWTWNIDMMTSSLLKEGGIRSRKRIKGVSSSEDLRRSMEGAIYDVMIAGQLITSSGWEAHEVRYGDDQAQETTRPTDSETMPSQSSSQQAGGTASPSWNPRHLGRAPQCLTLDREQFSASSDLDQDRNRPIDWKIMLSHAKSQTIGRTLVLSKNRYLGLAPKLSKPGDHIFILFGLSEPAILRPQADGSYIFIGTAYVHGVMKGEALKDLEEGVFTRERVTIR